MLASDTLVREGGKVNSFEKKFMAENPQGHFVLSMPKQQAACYSTLALFFPPNCPTTA
jgi:hypothetical protein